MEGQRDCKAPKLKTADGIIQPIITLTHSRRYNSIFDPYASDSSTSPSPLMKYLRSTDPAASIDSPPVFITPVKVEEDVIVMDGIPVPKSNRGSGEPRTRLPVTASTSVVGGRSNATSSLPSGSGGRGTALDNSRNYKHRLCRYWEISGICQFGFECQFAHGKEELRPPRSSGRIRLEIFKLNNSSEGLSSSSHGPKHPPLSQLRAEEETFPAMAFSASPAQVAHLTKFNTSTPRSDWSPLDDGIKVKLPSDGKISSKEDVDAYIKEVLYEGTNSRKRLPVFEELCHN